MESANIPLDVFNILKTLWSHTIISRYSLVSGATFYAWEYFLTLPDEVEYFWNSKWTFIKFLFFLNRYHRIPVMVLNTFFEVDTQPYRTMCVRTHPPQVRCSFLPAVYHDATMDAPKSLCINPGITTVEFGIVSGIFGALVVGVILQIRLHALYGQNRILILVVSTLFVFQLAVIITMGALDTWFNTTRYKELPALVPLTPFCNSTVPDYFYAVWIPQIVFDFVLVVLATARAVVCYREIPKESRSSGTLISIFLRDSILVFLVNFLVYLANLLMWQRGPRDLYTIVAFWALVIPSVIVNRMLINLRKAGNERGGVISSDTPGRGVHTMSTFRVQRLQREEVDE